MTDPIHDAHEVDRLTRGRPLTDVEIACYLADHQTALRHATARVGDEIAEQLRDRLAALSTTPAPDPTDRPEGQSCGCTCCSGTWVLDAISYRCSGGCRCTARWYEGLEGPRRSTP